jgi:RNA polymerase sigma factor, sigma-70 family
MDKQKADEIITEYLPKIYGFAVKKTFGYDEAEELSSEIAGEVYISLLHGGEIYNLEGYVWRISEHVYAKYVSSKKKRLGISIDGMEIPAFDDYTNIETDDELQRLRREIAFLTKTRREIVYAYYYEDKTIAKIAKEMRIPEGTVKWHLNKAKSEMKEGLIMERKIGKLGLKPIKACGFGHSGQPGTNGGPEYYLNDNQNLNIVYSVYHTSRTKEEIAEELGVTPVFIEDKIEFLEGNGFLVRQPGNKFTTYVLFYPETYSIEQQENIIKKKLEIAEFLAIEYAPKVRASVVDLKNVYIPGGNRELLEAAAIFYGPANRCCITVNKDLSQYTIKTTDGGKYIAFAYTPSTPSDPDYIKTIETPSYWACGNMTRGSIKYPSVYSWSIDTRYSSREGAWQNNLTSDYEYLYEFITGAICENSVNIEKFKRLRERKYITTDNKVNIMVMKGCSDDFFSKIPSIDEKCINKKLVDFALESAELEARDYPPQMRDLIISQHAGGFIDSTVAVMVMDILYGNGTFKPLTENERVTSNLIMFCDTLPTN